MLSSLRMPLPRLSNEGDDPFSQYTKPPPHETDDEKTSRLRREAEEKRVNDEIDEYIKAEKAALKKRKTEIKLLLLGQSESGSSFILFLTLSQYTCPSHSTTMLRPPLRYIPTLLVPRNIRAALPPA